MSFTHYKNYYSSVSLKAGLCWCQWDAKCIEYSQCQIIETSPKKANNRLTITNYTTEKQVLEITAKYCLC